MKLSSREIMLGAATAVTLLAGLSFWIVKPKIEVWKELAVQQKQINREIQLFEHLLSQKTNWVNQLSRLENKLKKYSPTKDVTADYLKILENVANKSNISLIRRMPQQEKKHGNIYELAINCTWEADLDALIRFLYQLEQQKVTMDTEQLSIKVVSAKDKNTLTGRFTLMCMYTREQSTGQSSDMEPEPTGRE
jgi:uncharacterized protein Smg (DUF494 family)